MAPHQRNRYHDEKNTLLSISKVFGYATNRKTGFSIQPLTQTFFSTGFSAAFEPGQDQARRPGDVQGSHPGAQ